MSLMSLTAVELGKKIKAGEVTVKEAVTEALDAIEKKEKTVGSFVTVDREGALKRAEEVQKQIDDGTLTGPLAGVPVAIKDNMCTKGMLTTCSSRILYNFKPTYTAEAVKNLEEMYEQFGFIKISTRKKYYDSPVEDGLVMKKQL